MFSSELLLNCSNWSAEIPTKCGRGLKRGHKGGGCPSGIVPNRLHSKNCSQIVVDRGNTAGLTHILTRARQGPVAPLKSTSSTQDNRLALFFSNPDLLSYASGNFTVSPWLQLITSRSPYPLPVTDSNCSQSSTVYSLKKSLRRTVERCRGVANQDCLGLGWISNS